MPGRRRHALVCFIFLRILGLVYFVAFASFATQAPGLIGSHGITPVQEFIEMVSGHAGSNAFSYSPSLFWFSSSDQAIMAVALCGTALSLLLVFDVLSFPVLVLLWILWLSIVNCGSPFMSFQWDSLLCETGFISIFLGRWNLKPGGPLAYEPPLAPVLLLRFLLFRLMFFSGIVKLASGDPTWRDLTAMSYHYETQPLPLPLAWLLHKLPMWFHKGETVLTFIIELGVPLLIFAPRAPRFFAFGWLLLLQLAIIVSGNYAFFNLLTIGLCFSLLDDDGLRSYLPRSLKLLIPGDPVPLRKVIKSELLALPATVCLGLLAGSYCLCQLNMRQLVPSPMLSVVESANPYNIVNGYGLFAIMTTERPEISVEGSNDAINWKTYEFRYKPGPLNRALPVVAPMQPRLDWQMWFAALGSYQENPWFIRFLERLLEGEKDVLALLEVNPFPDKPPKFVRAELYSYHLSSVEELLSHGNWWTRSYKGEYFFPVSMRKHREDSP